jgi:hypothetical protein
MTIKVSDVMRHVRNHFIHSTITATWTHEGGTLALAEHLAPAEKLTPGMWIAVTGAGAPTGVYQLDEQGGIPNLGEMTWSGTVYVLDPPADFLRLCGDIACWAAANSDPGITAEKLGEYSVSRKSVTWQEAFAPALRPYLRMYAEVAV